MTEQETAHTDPYPTHIVKLSLRKLLFLLIAFVVIQLLIVMCLAVSSRIPIPTDTRRHVQTLDVRALAPASIDRRRIDALEHYIGGWPRLRIEVVPTGDGPTPDVHLVWNGGEFGGAQDCHLANCSLLVEPLRWGQDDSTLDDPLAWRPARHDQGIEVAIPDPAPGTYDVLLTPPDPPATSRGKLHITVGDTLAVSRAVVLDDAQPLLATTITVDQDGRATFVTE